MSTRTGRERGAHPASPGSGGATRTVAVGLTCAVVGGLVAWGLADWAREPPARPKSAARAPLGASERARQVLGGARRERSEAEELATCKRALVQQRAELRFVRDEAARVAAERMLDDDGPFAPVGTGRPASGQIQSPSEGSSDPADARRQERETSAKVRETVVEHLRISEEEKQIMKDLVCAHRDNTRSLIGEFAEGQVDADAFIRAMVHERSLNSEGLRRALGPRRFKRLRQVGAIGLLAAELCKRQ